MMEFCFEIIWGYGGKEEMEASAEWYWQWASWPLQKGDNYMGFIIKCSLFLCLISLKKKTLFLLAFKNSYNLDLIIYFSSFTVNFSSIQSRVRIIVTILSLSVSFLKSGPLCKLLFLPVMFFLLVSLVGLCTLSLSPLFCTMMGLD